MQTGEQGTVVKYGNTGNSIGAVKERVQQREGVPANQQRLVFEVPANLEERVETAVEKAAAAAKAAQAAAEERQQVEQRLARFREKKAQKVKAVAAANNRGAKIQAAENAQRAAAAAVEAAERAVKAAGVREKESVTVACGALSDAVVDLQQLFGSAVASGVHQPTKSVTLDLKETLKLADNMARSAETLKELDVTCPLPKFPTLPTLPKLPKLGLTLPTLFGSRTATAAPPPPPPGGPGYTFAAFLPGWPGHGGPPHVPQRAEPPQAAMLLAAAAPPRPPTNEGPGTLRLRLRTAHGFREGDTGSVAAAAGNKRGNKFKPANNSLAGVKGTTNVGGIGERVKARAAGAGEGGGTRRTRRHRGTRRH